jgi:hypothetical protein
MPYLCQVAMGYANDAHLHYTHTHTHTHTHTQLGTHNSAHAQVYLLLLPLLVLRPPGQIIYIARYCHWLLGPQIILFCCVGIGIPLRCLFPIYTFDGIYYYISYISYIRVSRIHTYIHTYITYIHLINTHTRVYNSSAMRVYTRVYDALLLSCVCDTLLGYKIRDRVAP